PLRSWTNRSTTASFCRQSAARWEAEPSADAELAPLPMTRIGIHRDGVPHPCTAQDCGAHRIAETARGAVLKRDELAALAQRVLPRASRAVLLPLIGLSTTRPFFGSSTDALLSPQLLDSRATGYGRCRGGAP